MRRFVAVMHFNEDDASMGEVRYVQCLYFPLSQSEHHIDGDLCAHGAIDTEVLLTPLCRLYFEYTVYTGIHTVVGGSPFKRSGSALRWFVGYVTADLQRL